DLVNNLRGQVTGTTSGIQRIVDQIETLSSRIDALEARITDEVPAEAPLSKTLTCKASGCDEPYRAKGFCARHYQQWKRGRLPEFPQDT
ncbi:MAG: hypothetical protein ACPGTU_20160, partial [Myxococcota bacterium]